MQRIVIRGFGPIVDVDIEIKQILVLIGEQASGKSTIAKLIYFFKSLGDDVFDSFYSSDRLELNRIEDMIKPIKAKFYDFFGSTKHLPNFEIKFFYEHNRHINLSLDQYRSLKVSFSSTFIGHEALSSLAVAKRELKELDRQVFENHLELREKVALEQDKIKAINAISEKIDQLFSNQCNSSLYVIGGREATVSYGGTFDAYLENTLANTIEENRKKIMKAKEQTIDETLMINFLKEVRRIKAVFRKYGGTFRDVVENLSSNDEFSTNLVNSFIEIVKGDYLIDDWGEAILHTTGQKVYLKDASSGQKEVIRIIQDLLLCVLERRKAFRVIEEPETHLFPIAQKKLVELLVGMKNSNPNNQLVITTHSPYILTSLNNLLFATRVRRRNDATITEVDALIPPLCQINPDEFAAYSLGSSINPEGVYCSNIFNSGTGTIRQNFLDSVSDLLASEFNQMYALHAQSFNR